MSPFTMDDDGALSRLVNAIKETQSAFERLCSAIHVPNSESKLRDHIMALDVSLQSLGTIVDILRRIGADGGQIDFVLSVLEQSVTKSASGQEISVVDVILTDMHNLAQRLTDVLHDVTAADPKDLPILIKLLPLGEVISIQGMVEKYHAMIKEVTSAQNMCVITS
jgi:hypothetical protein